jgi:hypothetical protein
MLNVKNAKIRIVLIILIFSITYLSRYIFLINYNDDIFENLLIDIYNNLRAFETLRDKLQIINFLILDLVLVFVCYLWIMYDKTWRFIMSIISFLSFKLAIAFIFEQKSHEDKIWNYPGFPSISTIYYPNNLNFIDSSSGLYIVLICELNKIKYKKLSKFLIFFFILNLIFLLSLKASNIVSILSGIMIGYYSFCISNKYSNILNYIYDFDKAIRYSNIKYTNLDSHNSANTVDNIISMTVDSRPEDMIKIYENVSIPCGYNISDIIYSYSAVSIAGQKYY